MIVIIIIMVKRVLSEPSLNGRDKSLPWHDSGSVREILMNKQWLFVICAVAGLSNTAHGEAWGYTGPGGPENWGGLRPDYAACASGMMQSPIDITDAVKAELAPIEFHYRLPGTPAAENNGRTIRITIPEGRFIVVDGKRYDLVRIKFHSPSENTIAGHAFAMSAHFIHHDISEETAIVAVMFEPGETNPALNKIWKKLPARAGGRAHFLTLDIAPLLPRDKSYYTFTGSLTEPPCSEGVRWFVLKNPVPIGKEQLDKFREIFHGNVRPIQSVNGREILTN